MLRASTIWSFLKNSRGDPLYIDKYTIVLREGDPPLMKTLNPLVHIIRSISPYTPVTPSRSQDPETLT